MIQASGEALDRDELARRVREEVLRARRGGEPERPPERPRGLGPLPALEPLLAAARQNAAVGSSVPAMRRVPWPARPLARLFGWAALRVLGLTARPQRAYNLSLVDTADVLTRRVRELEAVVAHLEDRMGAMQAAVLEAQLFCREMGTLQARFDFLDVWTRDTLAGAASGREESHRRGEMSPAGAGEGV